MIEIPGSLSYTTRALLISAMTQGAVKIINPAKSDDSYALVTILRTVGIKITEGENFFIVEGSIHDVKEDEYLLDAQISGRCARSILAFLAIIPGTKTLTCKNAFKKRPIQGLVDGLTSMGASVEYLEEQGKLPVRIRSTKLLPGVVRMAGEVSSQYFSALMMIAPFVGELVIEVEGEQSSKSFIDVTIDILHSFGISVKNDDYKRYTILGNQSFKNPGVYTVEADAIAAGYFWAVAALTKRRVRVLHLSPDSKQGDIAFADILGQMGCLVKKNRADNWIEVEGTNSLTGVTVDMNSFPDSILTLAVVSAFAQGKTHITGIRHAKAKESDRIEAPKQELIKMGVPAFSTEDSLTIVGGTPKACSIDTHGDHRIAMAFAVARTKISGMTIEKPEVVSKSFPHFWQKLWDILQ